MSRFGLTLAAALPACAGGADGAMEAYKAQAIGASPLIREIAASNTFYFCKPHPEPDRFVALCEVCNVDLYADKDLPFNADPDTDAPVIGVKGWATHFYHEFKPWDEGTEPRISVTGERATQKFETNELTTPAIEAVFEAANGWCQARRSGEFQILKNEIESFVGRLPS